MGCAGAEGRLVDLTKAPTILLHWLGWRACFEPVTELIRVTRARPLLENLSVLQIITKCGQGGSKIPNILWTSFMYGS